MTKNLLSLPLKSKCSSRKEWEKACWQKISKRGEFLDLLTTANERRNIVIRAAVIELVNSGKGFRQIARELQVSLQTVSGIKKALKENAYKSYRERGKTERKKKVWSRDPSRKKKEPYRYYRRTKYGKVYMPYY